MTKMYILKKKDLLLNVVVRLLKILKAWKKINEK